MKVWNYIVLSVLLALLFEMAGIPVATSMLTHFGINITSGLTIQTAVFWLKRLKRGSYIEAVLAAAAAP